MLEEREREKEVERLRLGKIVSRFALVVFVILLLCAVWLLKIGGYIGPKPPVPAVKLPADGEAKPGESPARKLAEKLDIPFGGELIDFLK